MKIAHTSWHWGFWVQLAGVVGGVALPGCAIGNDAVADRDQPQTVTVEHEPTTGLSWEEYRDRAARKIGDNVLYVVEEDLVFPTENELRTYYENTVLNDGWKLAVFQRISTGYEPIYTSTEAVRIRYCVSDLFQTSYAPFNKNTVVQDMATATTAWQNTINVSFVYTSAQDANCTENNANVEFAVIPLRAGSSMFSGCNKHLWMTQNACTTTSGGSAIGILSGDYSWALTGTFAGKTFAGILTHELGHILGFRHEHPWAPNLGGCFESPTIASIDVTGRRLTTYDQASVMHYPQCNGLVGVDFSISAMDGQGARSIYGMPAAWYVATGLL